MARRRRSSKRLGSTVLNAVKVCKLKGRKLVCRSMKLGSTVLNGRRKASRKSRR